MAGMISRRLLLLGIALTAGPARSVETTPATQSFQTGPLPSVVRFAQANGIPLAGLALAGPLEAARPGDRLTVLFTLAEGTDLRQWLGDFQFVPLTAREAQSKPGTGLGFLGLFQSSLKTDSGHEYRFDQVPVALEMRTHGPFVGDDHPHPPPAVAAAARVLATRDYLARGLAPMAEIELRLRAAGKADPGLSFLFRPRFSAEQRTAAQARATEAGFTAADERVFAEGFFALVQFANLAFRTDGVETIMREVADSPTLFSGAFVHLDWPNLQIVDGRAWGLPGVRVYQIPYEFRSKTKAHGSFFATAARPPLQTMAGIVGLTVDWTSKAPAKRLIVQVLAGKGGTP